MGNEVQFTILDTSVVFPLFGKPNKISMKNPLLDVNLHTCYANKNICARIFHPEGLPQDVQRSSENKVKEMIVVHSRAY